MPEEQPLTVTQAMMAAKRSLEQIRVTVVGEVSEFNDKPGYKAAYFTVSDDGAAMPCLMWRDQYVASGVILRPGMLVTIRGSFGAYVPKGRMQFTVRTLEPVGEGALRMQVAQLARKLEAEGLMDATRKKAFPRFPRTIAVVTSPRGKAIHDVLRTLRRRWPLAEVCIAGIPVEGEGAHRRIAEGLLAADEAGPDVTLLVRGGGSYEDLMPFNHEDVARAIIACKAPVVTGIGHEPDTTIADMVSDLRASTPTASAEAVTPPRSEIEAGIDGLGRSLARALAARLDLARNRVEALAQRPVLKDPSALFDQAAQSIDLLGMRLSRALPERIERDKTRVGHARDRLAQTGTTLLARFENQAELSAARLHDLSPLAILSRGYAVSYSTKDDTIVTSVSQLTPGDEIRVRVSDGSFLGSVTQIGDMIQEQLPSTQEDQ